MKKRVLCALTIIAIIIIIGLHHFDVALLEYNGTKEGNFVIKIESQPKETSYYNVYNGKINNKKFLIYVPKKSEILSNGDKIEAKAVFNAPEKARNTGGFDYSLYLKSKKIYGSFKIDEITKIHKAKRTPLMQRIQNNIKTNFYENLRNENASLAIRITTR